MESDTFNSFREWLISFEGQTPERASVIAANLRKAESLLSNTYVYKGQTLILNIYKDLKGVNACRPEFWTKGMKPILKQVNKVFNYILKEPGFIGTYDEYSGNKQSLINNIQTAFISYLHFLSVRYECFNLKDVQKSISSLYEDEAEIPKSIRGLANWAPVEKCSDANKKKGLFNWLGWKFHNSGLSGMLRKCGATILSQGDEQLVQMPMAQFEKFLKAYEQAVGGELSPDIYKNSSFIRDLSSPIESISPVKETLGRSIQLYVGNTRLDFDETKSLKVNLDDGTIIMEDFCEQEDSIKLPILSGRAPEKRKLTYRMTNSLPIDEQATILSELREKCRFVQNNLEGFISSKPRTKIERLEVLKDVNVYSVFESANSALGLLQRFASHIRIDLVIE